MSNRRANGKSEHVQYAARVSRDEAVERLEAILESLRSGDLSARRGDESIRLRVANNVRFEFDAKRKKRYERMHITLRWDRPKQQKRLVLSPGNVDPASNGTECEDYEDWTRDELYEAARKNEVAGRSDMSKAELIAALRGNP